MLEIQTLPFFGNDETVTSFRIRAAKVTPQ